MSDNDDDDDEEEKESLPSPEGGYDPELFPLGRFDR